MANASYAQGGKAPGVPTKGLSNRTEQILLVLPDSLITWQWQSTGVQIAQQPHNQRCVSNEAVQFAVSARSGFPLRYQWIHNGVGISGATTDCHRIDLASGADTGNYYVTVSNFYSSVTSDVAFLDVVPAFISGDRWSEYPRGDVLDVCAQDSWVYAALGVSGIGIYEWDGATNLTQVAHYAEGMNIQDVSINSNLLCAISGNGVFLVIDVSIPENPRQLGKVELPLPTDLVFNGEIAYVVCYSRLIVVDVSNPSSPHVRGEASLAQGGANGIAVHGNTVVIGSYWDGITVFDVSNLDSPQVVGGYSTNHVYGVTIRDNLVFAGCDRSGIQVFDISTPALVRHVGGTNTQGSSKGVAIVDDHVYLGDGYRGLMDFNYDSLGNMSLAASCPDVDVSSICTLGESTLVVGGYDGISAYSLAENEPPELLATLDTGGNYDYRSVDIVTGGGHAYVADGAGGIRSFDIVAPGQLSYTACPILGLLSPARRIVMDDERLLATDGSYLHLFHLGSTVTKLGSGNVSQCGAMELIGERVYHASLKLYTVPGLGIVDVSRPTRMNNIGFYATSNRVDGFCITGDIAWLACGRSGLLGVDVHDAENPVLLSSTGLPGRVYDVAVRDGVAYVATDYYSGGGGLVAINVSDPVNPIEISSCRDNNDLRCIVLSGNMAYAVTHSGDICVYDISDPAGIWLVATYSPPGKAEAISVVGRYAYIATAEYGVQVVSLNLLETQGFRGWMVDAESYGRPAVAFTMDFNHNGIADGFEYAFGTNLVPSLPMLNIRMINGECVIDFPVRMPDTAHEACIGVRGSTNLVDWTYSTRPVYEPTGKPSNRQWFEPVEPQDRMFFRLEGELLE